jgi:hypothetical protein
MELEWTVRLGGFFNCTQPDPEQGRFIQSPDARASIAAGRRRWLATEAGLADIEAKRGVPRSEETKAQISATKSINPCRWFLGKKHKPETIAKMSKPKTAEHVRRQAEAQRGKPRGPEAAKKGWETRRKGILEANHASGQMFFFNEEE